VGIHWPRDFGGQGLTVRHTIAFTQELVRARAPQPVGAIGLEVVGPTILRYGSAGLSARFLPPLLSGEELWCQGFSEPDAGSDLASLRTTALPDGDSLVVSGQKTWTSWAVDADWCAVLARMDQEAPAHRGIGYLLVDMRSPGVSVRPITQLTGETEFCEVFFTNVRVPRDQVLGGPGDGWRMAMDTLGHERAGYAIRRGMENRTAFLDLVDAIAQGNRGAPDDALALGELYVLMEAFDANVEVTVERLSSGDVPSPHDSVDKLLLTETEQALYKTATDVLGALRAVPDASDVPDAQRWTKGLLYARAASVYGGSSEIQRSIVAERLLGLPKAR
jgi:alkylation response protein AidB-like acyl-CoA dehydrogenase